MLDTNKILDSRLRRIIKDSILNRKNIYLHNDVSPMIYLTRLYE